MWLPLLCPLLREDLACNPGMWQSNWPAFGLQASAPSTDHTSQHLIFKLNFNFLYVEIKLINVFQGIILHTGIVIAFQNQTFNTLMHEHKEKNLKHLFIQIQNQYCTLIFPSKTCAKKCALYIVKYGNFRFHLLIASIQESN